MPDDVEKPINLFKVFMSPDTVEPVKATLRSGFVTQGPRVEEYEAKLKEYLDGYPHVLTLNSCTSALHLAFHMLKTPFGDWPGMQPEDEVLTTALTCTATNWPAALNGWQIRWVDVSLSTCNIDIHDLRSKISARTKVILFVHWAGTPVDLDQINMVADECAEKHGFRPFIVEDCAHAFGATWKGKKVGTQGNIGVFSTQAIKHLTTGDGGFITLPNKEMYDRAKLLRWFGIDREKRSGGGDFRLEPDVPECGFKFHMNDINATIGLHNLPHIDKEVLAKHRSNAAFYNEALQNIEGVTLLEPPPEGVSSYWIYTLKVRNRDHFLPFMKERGVVCSSVHSRNDRHTCMAPFKSYLPKLDILEKEYVSLPVGWWVTEKQREYVAHCVKDFSGQLPPHIPMQQKKVIITGGCGFIGSHLVEHFAKKTSYQIIVLDVLNYAAPGCERLRDTLDPQGNNYSMSPTSSPKGKKPSSDEKEQSLLHRVRVYCVDLRQPLQEGFRRHELGGNIEIIIHMAAESHVDNSIAMPVPFTMNNVDNTLTMLEYARQLPDLKHFFYFSTDEVFGPALGDKLFTEDERHRPTNPYSASKSAAEVICQGYENTYKIPLVITNLMNVFGERQHPEKFIPKCINHVLKGEKIYIHSYPDLKRAGTRFYIHARNVAAAILFLMDHGKIGEKYNITGEQEVDNLTLAEFVAKVVGKPLIYELTDSHSDRPGHDLRYGLDGSKMRKMGWKLPVDFWQSLEKTIRWTIDNPVWLQDFSEWEDRVS